MARSDDFWSAFIHAMDVYNDNLSPVINRAEKNNDIIIFEKYATWCGHCQAMAPNFDGAAKHFNEVGGLLLSKGTCSNNPQLCNYLGVIGYPSFYYGTAEDFRNVRTSPPPSLNELRSVSSAADMIDFLSERFGIESTTTNNNHGTDHTMPPNNDINQTTAPAYTLDVAAYLSDIEMSTSDSLQQALVSSHLISQKGARDAFIDWQGFIADSHPSDKCRRGAQDILDELDDLWPKDNYSPGTVRSNLLTKKQCLSDYSDVEYQGCAVGGNPGAYTCGLWQTFHAMSVAPDTKFGGSEMFRRLGQFIKYFFTCTICQEHFLAMMASVNSTTVTTEDTFIIWLFEAHNEVNERLREEELDAGTFNMNRPKGLFPSPELCENCLDEREGNYVGPYVGEFTYTLPFLGNFYGEDLESGVSAVGFNRSVDEDDGMSSGHRLNAAAAGTFTFIVAFFF
jgi:thiol oxidase